MVTWEPYAEAEGSQGWNSLLLQADDYTVFQSFEWGEYKRGTGWQPLRYVGYKHGGKVAGLAQVLVKLLPFGLGVVWAPGGPVLRFEGSSDPLGRDLSVLIDDLHKQFPRALVRFDSHMAHDATLTYAFNQSCRRPLFKLNSGYSIRMNLAALGDGFARQMTSKHRYYVKKGEGASLRWESGSSGRDIGALARIHGKMVTEKNIPSIATSETDIVNLRCALGEQGITILTGYLDEEPVTSCLTFDFGNKSIYMVAATEAKGREIGAAYAMVARLIALLQQKGIREFDFGGLDPARPSAEGVNHFKRGFGGKIVEYLGEWEAARTDLVRWGTNLAIWKRRGRV